jgi:hypothetical protein
MAICSGNAHALRFMVMPRRRGLSLEQLEVRETPAIIGLDQVDSVVSGNISVAEQRPRIASRPDGAGFVVVWDAPDGGGGTDGNADLGIFAQRYDANWQPTGSSFRINTFINNTQSRPAIGMDASGNFVVAWQSFLQVSSTSLFDIYARRFSADGTPLDTAEFLVNSNSSTDGFAQRGPAVGVAPGGRFAVSWWGGKPFEENVFVKGYAGLTFGGDGAPTVKFAETMVNNLSASTDDQINPAVALNDTGPISIAYQSYNQDGGITSPGRPDYGVYIRQLNFADGSALTPEIRVNTVVDGDQLNPDLAIDSAGNFVVVWDSPNVDGSGTAVLQQRYNSSGTAVGSNVTVNTSVAGNQRAPRVARTAAGDYMVSWVGSEPSNSGTDIFYRRYNTSGASITAEMLVNKTTANDGTTQTDPALILNNANDFVVVYESAGDVVMRRFGEAPVVAFSQATSALSEAVTDRQFTLNRSGATYVIANTSTQVSVSRISGSTTAPPDSSADYSTTLPLSLTFNPGTTSHVGQLTVVNDSTVEADETLLLGISSSSDATIGSISEYTEIILNDDTAVSLTVSPGQVAEDSGQELVFTFTRTGVLNGHLGVNFSVGGTAIFGTDYTVSGAGSFTATSGNVTITDGMTSASIRIRPIANSAIQVDRTLQLSVTAGTGYNPVGSAVTATILDDDTGVSLLAAPASMSESSASDFVFTFTRFGVIANSRTINFSVSGTAAFGGTNSDYTTSGADTFSGSMGTITFLAGSDTAELRIRPVNDSIYEWTESITVTIAAGDGYTILAQNTAEVTIVDDDPLPSISVSDVTVSESSGTVTFQVTRTGGTALPVSVNYTTDNDSALSSGSGPGEPDYVSASGTLTFSPSTSVSETKLVTVSLVTDQVYELTERFSLLLSNVVGGTLLVNRGYATITDDDTAPSISVSDVSVSESSGTVTFQVTRTGSTALPLSVSYAAENDTALSSGSLPGEPDYVSTSGTLSFAPSNTMVETKLVSVSLVNDQVYELSEIFSLFLSNVVNGTLVTNRGYATITDDDPLPTLSVNDVTASESSGMVTFTVTRSGGTSLPIAVDYKTVSDTALSSGTNPGEPDFTITSGTLNFAASSSQTQTQTIAVPLVADGVYESSEQFFLDLFNASGATIATSRGTGSIVDDDPVPTVSISDVSVSESSGSVTFQITRTGGTAFPVSVSYATENDTALSTGSGVAELDYVNASGTITFQPSTSGVQTELVSVSLENDLVYELTERFSLLLSNVLGGTLSVTRGYATITDDDPLPTLSLSDVTVSEADGTATFTVTRTGGTALPLTVNYETENDTALSSGGGPGEPDYVSANGTLNFAPSALVAETKLVTVSLADDQVYELSERFSLFLSNVVGGELSVNRGYATITDDDPLPTFSINDVTVNEADGTATFTVTRTGGTALILAVDYKTASGTAVSSGNLPGTPDYSVSNGALSFSPSTSQTLTQTVSIALVNDSVYELAEQFFLDLENAIGGMIDHGRGLATVVDDDPLPTVSVNDVTVSEADGTVAFTVTRTGGTALPLSADYKTVSDTALSSGGFPGEPDYVEATGTLTFAPSTAVDETKLVTVNLVNDQVHELTERFSVLFSNVAGGTLTVDRGNAIVTDDDPLPTVSLTTSAPDFSETSSLEITASLSALAIVPVVVNLDFSGSATTNRYTASQQSITIPVGALSAKMTIAGVNDSLDQNAETVIARITSATNATIGTDQVTVSLLDDDLPSAFQDTFNVSHNTPLDVQSPGLLQNDNYAPGSTIELVGAIPAHGTLTLASTGGLTYTPVMGFSGLDSFTYRIVNLSNEVSTATTVSLTVAAPPPTSPPPGAPPTSPPPGVPPTSPPPGVPPTSPPPGVPPTSPPPGVPPTSPPPGVPPTSPPPGVPPTSPPPGVPPTSPPPGVPPTSPPPGVPPTSPPPGVPPTSGTRVKPPLVVGGLPNGTAEVYAPTLTGEYSTQPSAIVSPFGSIPSVLRTATADINGDGVFDLVLVTGPGVPIRVTVLDGRDNITQLIAPFDPFTGDFKGGGYVSAADIDQDGRAEFAVTPDQGGGPRVSIFALAADGTRSTRANFFGIDDPSFRGGARASLGDVNADGTLDVVVAAGFGGGPRTAIFGGKSVLNGSPSRLVPDFFAFPGSDAVNLRNGSFVTVGDITGDGFADLVFGGGPGGAPRVFALSGSLVSSGNVDAAQSSSIANFFVAGDIADRGGARVAITDSDGDNRADLVVGSGAGRQATIRIYPGKGLGSGVFTGTEQALSVFGGVLLADGVYVG